MYEYAMYIWNMSADEFIKWLIYVCIILFVAYEGRQEINTNRAKRFTKK